MTWIENIPFYLSFKNDYILLFTDSLSLFLSFVERRFQRKMNNRAECCKQQSATVVDQLLRVFSLRHTWFDTNPANRKSKVNQYSISCSVCWRVFLCKCSFVVTNSFQRIITVIICALFNVIPGQRHIKVYYSILRKSKKNIKFAVPIPRFRIIRGWSRAAAALAHVIRFEPSLLWHFIQNYML